MRASAFLGPCDRTRDVTSRLERPYHDLLTVELVTNEIGMDCYAGPIRVCPSFHV